MAAKPLALLLSPALLLLQLPLGSAQLERPRAYCLDSVNGACIRETVVMILLGLGMKLPAARIAVAIAWQRLQDASEHLHWWKPVAPA